MKIISKTPETENIPEIIFHVLNFHFYIHVLFVLCSSCGVSHTQKSSLNKS